MRDSFAKSVVEKLLSDHKCSKYKENHKGMDIWIAVDDTTIIQIPSGFRRVDFEVIQVIAEEQLDLNVWQLDMWLGENT